MCVAVQIFMCNRISNMIVGMYYASVYIIKWLIHVWSTSFCNILLSFNIILNFTSKYVKLCVIKSIEFKVVIMLVFL